MHRYFSNPTRLCKSIFEEKEDQPINLLASIFGIPK